MVQFPAKVTVWWYKMTVYKIIPYEYGHAAHYLVRFQSSFSYTVQQANNTALSGIIRVHDTPYKTWSLVSRFRPCFVGAGPTHSWRGLPSAGMRGMLSRFEYVNACLCLISSCCPQEQRLLGKKVWHSEETLYWLFLGWWELVSVPKMSVLSANTSKTPAHCTIFFAL